MLSADIVDFARQLKKYWKTNDPYELAVKYGIEVVFRNFCFNDFRAQTLKMDGYPTIISINSKFDDNTKRILCAHELGHALLHENVINYFSITSKNVRTNVEGEANLFAIALLSDDNINDLLTMPIEKMSSYLLKTIVEYNIKI